MVTILAGFHGDALHGNELSEDVQTALLEFTVSVLDGEEGVAEEGMEVCGGLHQLHRDREEEKRREREERWGKAESNNYTHDCSYVSQA